MSYYMKAAKAAKDGNINTFSQLMALGILNDADNGCTMSFLAKSLGISGASMTMMADKFEEIGVAKRAAEPHDRRAFRLKITAKGRDTFNQILP